MPRFGRGRRRGRGFGFWQFPGYNRWLRAQQVGDPDRAMFGLGPCGELAYQQYKRTKESKE